MLQDDDDDLLRGRLLPEPTLTLTLPSVHDGTTLDCRVFHPFSLSASLRAPPWQGHAAIVAHPYAPLGGCYDDPVVDIVASTSLRLGYLVCTFNFRGASGSAGRTSWTAKAECADYISVVGFLAYYVHFLNPFHQARHKPLFLMAGYSYGAMITTQLPGLDKVLSNFGTPAAGSPAAEIRLRAEHLAGAQNAVLGSCRAAALDRQHNKSPRKVLAMRIGGDEESRKSHESPRRSFSLDAEEKFKDLIAKAKKGHNRRASSDSVPKKKLGASIGTNHAVRDGKQDQPQQAAEVQIHAVSPMTMFRPAYLLVSPLQGLITHLATMSFQNPFGKRTRRVPDNAAPRPAGNGAPSPPETKEASDSDAEYKLIINPTLAVYGDQDIFVAARKLRDWARRLQSFPNSQFRAHEISTGGHFWTEGRVVFAMRDAVKTFAAGLLSSDNASPGQESAE